MLSLIDYTNRLSVRAGESIEFKVSSLSRDPYHARLVRVVCADPNPAGPGLIENPVASEFEGKLSPLASNRSHPARMRSSKPPPVSRRWIPSLWLPTSGRPLSEGARR